jgi:hypothetical protein
MKKALKDTGCPRVAKKLHNLFVIKDINFYFFQIKLGRFYLKKHNFSVFIILGQSVYIPQDFPGYPVEA